MEKDSVSELETGFQVSQYGTLNGYQEPSYRKSLPEHGLFCSRCHNGTSQYFLSVTCYLCQFIMKCIQALHHEAYFIFLEWEIHIYVKESSSTDVLFSIYPQNLYIPCRKNAGCTHTLQKALTSHITMMQANRFWIQVFTTLNFQILTEGKLDRSLDSDGSVS